MKTNLEMMTMKPWRVALAGLTLTLVSPRGFHGGQRCIRTCGRGFRGQGLTTCRVGCGEVLRLKPWQIPI